METHSLEAKFHERVQEEIDYNNDPAAKNRRIKRQIDTRDKILKAMSTKYRPGYDFSTITDQDEVGILPLTLYTTQKKFFITFFYHIFK